jgi:hypothetical protein
MRLAIKEAVIADPHGLFEASLVGSAAPGWGPAAFSGGGRVGAGLEYNAGALGVGVYVDSFLKDILAKNLNLHPAIGLSFRF